MLTFFDIEMIVCDFQCNVDGYYIKKSFYRNKSNFKIKSIVKQKRKGLNYMELLFARNELNEKPKKVQLDKIREELKAEEEKIFYFDRDNSHKDMMALVDALEDDGYNVYFREVKYGLADDEYMYEVHAL